MIVTKKIKNLFLILQNPPPSESYKTPYGGNVDMRCQVVSDTGESIRIEWKRENGQRLPPNSIVRDGTLRITSVTTEDAGKYFCEGINSYGVTVFNAPYQLEVIRTLYCVYHNIFHENMRKSLHKTIK